MHSMRWGLVPHWSKAEPPTLNTINARAENLEDGGGMWSSVKGRKRCVVLAQGCAPSLSPSSSLNYNKNTSGNVLFFLLFSRYYEWLKKGAQRVPHFTRHKDKRLMLFAGLYDSVTLDGESFHSHKIFSHGSVWAARGLALPSHRSCEWNAGF